MKVYVVHKVEHDRWRWEEVDSRVFGVFTTREKAEEKRDQLTRDKKAWYADISECELNEEQTLPVG